MERPPPLRDLDRAEPAGADRLERRVVAQRGDLDARVHRGLEDAGPLVDAELPAVDPQADHRALTR